MTILSAWKVLTNLVLMPEGKEDGHGIDDESADGDGAGGNTRPVLDNEAFSVGHYIIKREPSELVCVRMFVQE